MREREKERVEAVCFENRNVGNCFYSPDVLINYINILQCIRGQQKRKKELSLWSLCGVNHL